MSFFLNPHDDKNIKDMKEGINGQMDEISALARLTEQLYDDAEDPEKTRRNALKIAQHIQRLSNETLKTGHAFAKHAA